MAAPKFDAAGLLTAVVVDATSGSVLVVAHICPRRQWQKSIQKQIDELESNLGGKVDDELQKNCYGFTKLEIAQNEEKYLSYQITTNVKTIFQKYVDKFEFTPISELGIDTIGQKITTVGEIKDLKVITTKKSKKQMAFATLAYMGQTVSLTIFPSQFEDMSNVKDGFVQIVGEFKENEDKSYGDYFMIVNKMNILSCLYGEDVLYSRYFRLDS